MFEFLSFGHYFESWRAYNALRSLEFVSDISAAVFYSMKLKAMRYVPMVSSYCSLAGEIDLYDSHLQCDSHFIAKKQHGPNVVLIESER